MKRPQIIAIAVAIVAVAVLYSLPRTVVNNDKTSAELATAKPEEEEHSDEETKDKAPEHKREVPQEIKIKINAWENSLSAAGTSEKKATFADSLAEAYKKFGFFDSSAKYHELSATLKPAAAKLIAAGNGAFEAAGFATSASKRKALVEKARGFFQQVLDEDPNNLEAKTSLAMTWVDTETPMKAIFLLREVVEKSPNYEPAVFNLGILSLQSRQFDKAAERFQKLVQLSPKDSKAWFYLGVALKETGPKEKAIEAFQKVLTLEKDPMAVAAAEEELEDLGIKKPL